MKTETDYPFISENGKFALSLLFQIISIILAIIVVILIAVSASRYRILTSDDDLYVHYFGRMYKLVPITSEE